MQDGPGRHKLKLKAGVVSNADIMFGPLSAKIQLTDHRFSELMTLKNDVFVSFSVQPKAYI